jgi:voltage-gated potassium channel
VPPQPQPGGAGGRPQLARAILGRSGGACEEERGSERRLAELTERADPVLAFLGVAFALLVAFDLANPGLSDPWRERLAVAGLVLWGVFVVDFVVRMAVAPSAWGFVKGHWLALVMLLIPTLRVLRLAALLRLGRALPAARVLSSSYRVTGVARRTFSSRTGYLGGSAAVATLAIAELVWLAERGEDTFGDFGDALLWAGAAVVGMHADPTPVTDAGRLVMLVAFAMGLVLIATLAATVGAYLLHGRDDR